MGMTKEALKGEALNEAFEKAAVEAIAAHQEARIGTRPLTEWTDHDVIDSTLLFEALSCNALACNDRNEKRLENIVSPIVFRQYYEGNVPTRLRGALIEMAAGGVMNSSVLSWVTPEVAADANDAVLIRKVHAGMYPALWEAIKDKGCPDWRIDGCVSRGADAEHWLKLLAPKEVKEAIFLDDMAVASGQSIYTLQEQGYALSVPGYIAAGKTAQQVADGMAPRYVETRKMR